MLRKFRAGEDISNKEPCRSYILKKTSNQPFHSRYSREEHASIIVERPAVVTVITVGRSVPARHLALKRKSSLAQADRHAVRDRMWRVASRVTNAHLQSQEGRGARLY